MEKKPLFPRIFGIFLEKKKFSNLAENWLIYSSDGIIFFIFAHKRENFLMDLAMDFEFFEVGQV